MKLDSKYFDSIRIKPEHVSAGPDLPVCDEPGCTSEGAYRAPKGRLREGEYFNFCLNHVRDYNKSYNYFAGMADDDIEAYRIDAATGQIGDFIVVKFMRFRGDRIVELREFVDHAEGVEQLFARKSSVAK